MYTTFTQVNRLTPMRLNHYRGGQGEPLVLIHGIGSRWQMWEPVIDQLRAHRDVIALDLPGFGASPMPPPGTPAGLDCLVTLVTGFLDELGVERPHCAGNSLGGLIVLEMARRGLARSANALSPAGFANRPEMLTARASLWLMVRAVPRAWLRGLTPRPAPAPAGRLPSARSVAHPTRISARGGADASGRSPARRGSMRRCPRSARLSSRARADLRSRSRSPGATRTDCCSRARPSAPRARSPARGW